MSFAESMKRIRIKKGMSQADLEKQSGISQSAISSIERGERSPTEETMRMLSAALHTSLADMLEPQEKKPADPAGVLDEDMVSLLVDLSVRKQRYLIQFDIICGHHIVWQNCAELLLHFNDIEIYIGSIVKA